jgi:tetratricopeptide (TPR) repeat protein
MSSKNQGVQFSSAGFDVSAAANDAEGDVVFEIGGGATKLEQPHSEKDGAQEQSLDTVMEEAEEYKRQGNEAFKQQNWDLALELYTKAIDATPGMTAVELLKLQQDFLEEQGKEMRQRFMEKEEERRKSKSCDTANKQDETKPEPPEPFVPPPHQHADKLSVYHCNRAAVYLHLQKYDDVIKDCDAAILWNPSYTKALMRRCQAYEALDKTDKALEDAKVALATEPSSVKTKQTVQRLEKLEAERMEKLKTETIEKLKELGNSILGNFGLSLDNFKAVQDPNTGSYSLSFGNGDS